MTISVCIPMYNESKVISDTARRLSDYCASNFQDYEIIFVNDGSTDGCDSIVKDLGLPHVKVTGYQTNRGKGYAVRTGMLESGGELRIFTDADLAYGTDIIGRAVGIMEENPGSDILIASRAAGKDGYAGYSFIRKLASKVYLLLLKIVGGLKVSDSQSGFKCFRGDAAEKVFSKCRTDRFAFDFEALCIADRLGLSIYEMPARVLVNGESKIHLLSDSVKMFRDIIRIRRRVKKELN